MSDPVSDGDEDYKMEDAEEGATFALPEVHIHRPGWLQNTSKDPCSELPSICLLNASLVGTYSILQNTMTFFRDDPVPLLPPCRAAGETWKSRRS